MGKHNHIYIRADTLTAISAASESLRVGVVAQSIIGESSTEFSDHPHFLRIFTALKKNSD
jgi:hypothetical protein|tara:strand:- start:569 stop:748 length:180 start_codon:yes stop_codon:yes gene_type:complete